MLCGIDATSGGFQSFARGAQPGMTLDEQPIVSRQSIWHELQVAVGFAAVRTDRRIPFLRAAPIRTGHQDALARELSVTRHRKLASSAVRSQHVADLGNGRGKAAMAMNA